MTAIVENDIFKNDFVYCNIKWDINDYAVGIFQEHWEIESPEFSVLGPDSKKTRWKLIFCIDPEKNDSAQNLNIEINSVEMAKNAFEEREESELVENEYRSVKLSLNLERSTLDEGPETVFVEWKTHCLCINGGNSFVAHEKRFFSNGDNYGVRAGIIFNQEEDFCYKAGNKTFLCQMLVYNPNFPSYSTNYNSSIDIDLCALSEDLKYIFDAEKFCDLGIEVSGKKINAHKAILCSRNRNLKSMIIGNDSSVIKLSELEYDGVLETLSYIYSGDIREISEIPSFAVKDAAAFLNLRSVIQLYVPEDLSITTQVNVHYLSFRWIIKNFSENTQNCLSSPCFYKDILEQSPIWRIHLYPRGINGKSKYVAILVQYIEGNLSKHVCVDGAVVIEDFIETFKNWKTFQVSNKPDMMFEDEKFIKRETLLKMLKDDTLKLAFKVRMRTSIDHSFDHKENEVLFDIRKNLQQLADDLLALYESKEFSDVVLCNGGEEIKAHKFILYARSLVLSDLLNNNEDRLVLSDMKLEILKIVLKYLYCASLEVTNVETLFDVYIAAENLMIPRLKGKCSHVLERIMKVNTVCTILNFSDDHEHLVLKEAALRYISCNSNAVFKQDEWHDLKLRKPSLCKHVEECLNSSLKKTKLSTISLDIPCKSNVLPNGSSENDLKDINRAVEVEETCSEVKSTSGDSLDKGEDTSVDRMDGNGLNSHFEKALKFE